MDSVDRSEYPIPKAGSGDQEPLTISALFRDVSSAQAAVQELREVGIRPDGISLITRDEDHHAGADFAGGVALEEIQEEGLTYRASPELPNDEDLASAQEALTGQRLPIVTDFEVPPNEPLGGSDLLGLTRDRDMVRRNEAATNAEEDIYTDFPDKPGGINPESPVAERAGANVQEEMSDRTDAAESAAVGAGLGSVAGLLVGLAALAVPGVGPFIAAGPLAGALGGMLAGGATGGIVGALATVGVPEEHAREYAARIEQGETLISVQVDPITCDQVERVLAAHGGEEIRNA